jgi:hypothetical protein
VTLADLAATHPSQPKGKSIAMNEETKRKKIRSYFSRSQPGAAVLFVVVGVIAVLLSLAGGRGAEVGVGAGILLFAGGLLWFFVAIMRQIKRPSGEQMDRWLEEDLAQIVERSFNKLGLDKSLKRREPLRITGPILWTTTGIPNRDLLWKKDKDDTVQLMHVTLILSRM